MTTHQYATRDDAAEAASKAIYLTIQMIEEALGVKFPRGDTPSQSRAIMIQCLQAMLY